MKNILLFASILTILFIAPVKSIAQEKSIADSTEKESSIEKKSYGLISTNYTSNIVFLGRKSSFAAPYLSVLAGYYDKSGLFVIGGASYLAAPAENRFDLFTLTTGYDYYVKKFSTGVSATGYVFNNGSYTVKSALTANLSAYADYDFGILEVYADGTMYFSNQSDFIFSTAVSHNFYTANDKLKISPTFSLYGGTQNYYSNYNNNKRFGQHMLNTGNSNTIGTGMMSGGIFNIQNYEFSVPIRYDFKHFRLIFLPVYAIPVNAATITDNQNTYKEDLNNNFFWSLGVIYKFSKQKK